LRSYGRSSRATTTYVGTSFRYVTTTRYADRRTVAARAAAEGEYHAALAVFELLLPVGRREHLQYHAVDADRSLDDVGHIAFARFWIEILHLLAGEFLVVAQ